MQTESTSVCGPMAGYATGGFPTGNWEKSLKKSVKVLDVSREIWDKHHAQTRESGSEWPKTQQNYGILAERG